MTQARLHVYDVYCNHLLITVAARGTMTTYKSKNDFAWLSKYRCVLRASCRQRWLLTSVYLQMTNIFRHVMTRVKSDVGYRIYRELLKDQKTRAWPSKWPRRFSPPHIVIPSMHLHENCWFPWPSRSIYSVVCVMHSCGRLPGPHESHRVASRCACQPDIAPISTFLFRSWRPVTVCLFAAVKRFC